MAVSVKIENTVILTSITETTFRKLHSKCMNVIPKKGDVVLDLFFGSGTSGIEAIIWTDAALVLN